jgi:hypothetical protein
MKKGHICVLLSPNLPNQTLDQRSDQDFAPYLNQWIETKGEGWLSRLVLATYSAPEIDEQVNNTDVHVVAANEANHEPEIEDDSEDTLVHTRKRKAATQGRQQNKKPKCKRFTRVVSYLHVTLNKSYFL